MGEKKGSDSQSINSSLESFLKDHGYEFIGSLRSNRKGLSSIYHVKKTEKEFVAKVITRQDCIDSGKDYLVKRGMIVREGEFHAIQHRNIIKIYETIFDIDGGNDNIACVIMEFAAGGTLAERIKGRPLSDEAVLQLGIELCNGLIHLHEKNYVHCDLKPSNILFNSENVPLIADLGTVQSETVSTTTSNDVQHYGTDGYRSPEHKLSAPLTPASDIYQLGCVLYEALTGKKFQGQPSPWQGLPDIAHPQLIDALKKMLLDDNKPNYRFRTADLAKAALEKVRITIIPSIKHSRKSWLDKFTKLFQPQVSQFQARPFQGLEIPISEGIILQMVEIPAGNFIMGSESDDPDAMEDEKPHRSIPLEHFWISRYPITRKQFYIFSYNNTDVSVAGHANWQTSDLPAAPVTWLNAYAFCHWMSQLYGRGIRLPSETQWEKAARGEKGQRYPWGEQKPDSLRCNFGGRFHGVTPVGKFSEFGDSPYGCSDMAGNVWEWTCTGDDGTPILPEKIRWGPPHHRVILKGGSWSQSSKFLRCASRLKLDPRDPRSDLGFRVVMI